MPYYGTSTEHERWSASVREREVEALIESQGWVSRRKKQWIELRVCPICEGGSHKDEWTFALNCDTAAGCCQRGKCAWTGTLTELRAELGLMVASIGPATAKADSGAAQGRRQTLHPDQDAWRKPHQDLLDNEVALAALLRERGITKDGVRRYKIGIKMLSGARPILVFPYFYRTGALAALKFSQRTEDNKKKVWSEPKGATLPPFGLQSVKGNEECVVTEGELDAISLDCLTRGQRQVLSAPSGCKGGLTAGEGNWVDSLESWKRVLILYDSDAPGREGAEKLAEVVGAAAKICKLPPQSDDQPLKDVCEFRVAGFDNRVLDALMAPQEPAGHPLVVAISDDELRVSLHAQLKAGLSSGYSTGLNGVDRLMGGLRGGEVTVMTAHTGSGKSAMAANILLNVARQGIPTLGASYELTLADFTWRIVQQMTGKFPIERKDGLGEKITPNELDDAFARLATLPMHVVNSFGGGSIDSFIDCVRFAVRRLGVRVVVLDHLHYLAIGSGDAERHVITELVYRTKQLALELDVHILLVAHPSRAARDKTHPGLSDLHGAASIEQLCDNGVSLERVKDHETWDAGCTRFHLQKLRQGRFGALGHCWLSFDKCSERFEDMDDPTGNSEESGGGDIYDRVAKHAERAYAPSGPIIEDIADADLTKAAQWQPMSDLSTSNVTPRLQGGGFIQDPEEDVDE